MTSAIQIINQKPRLKQFVHKLLVQVNQPRPRWICKYVLNRFVHKTSKATIAKTVRRDLFPFQGFSLGQGSTVEDYTTLNNGVGPVLIGKNVRVGISNVLMGPVEIGDDTILGQHVLLTGLDHNYEDVHQPVRTQGVSTRPSKIGSGSFIGANVSILPGVTIGNHVVVGAGSVVTRDIPDYSVAAGNPAKIIRQFSTVSKKWARV